MLTKWAPRLKALLSDPLAFWTDLNADRGGIGALLVPQVLVLAAIPATGSLLGGMAATAWMPALTAAPLIGGIVVAAAVQYALSIALWIALGLLIDAFAPTFDAERNQGQAMKLAFGAMLPLWLAGATAIIPFGALSALAGVAAMGYGCYLLYRGLPLLNATPARKARVYAVTVTVVLLVAALVASLPMSCVRRCAGA